MFAKSTILVKLFNSTNNDFRSIMYIFAYNAKKHCVFKQRVSLNVFWSWFELQVK